MSLDYESLDTVLALLLDSQEAEEDTRQKIREVNHFIDHPQGQWEPDVLTTARQNKRPRYTFDKIEPLVDQVAGTIEAADFTLRVRPSGGIADKDNAKIFDGLIRNIRNISGAEHIFNSAARAMITTGQDGWEIVQEFADAESFDQDLIIKKIHNWVDSVWFDANAQEQDNSDARFCFKLTTLDKAEYNSQFPDAAESPQSVGDNRESNAYFDKPPNVITIGQIYYKVETDAEIVLMTQGQIYEVDEEFEMLIDEMAAEGNQIEDRRAVKKIRVHLRTFSGGEWLGEPEITEFDLLPIVATYANYKITENKRITRGIVQKLMDAQRVLNYVLSRDVEEGALSPRGKYWMTREQMAGHTKKLSSLNTNTDPVQAYTHVDGQPTPFFQGGAQVNPGLQTTAANMNESINQSAGMFTASLGDNPGLQSGIAIDRQISQGDNATTKYTGGQSVALCYTGKILLNAIPRVFDATRTVRILSEDGSFEMQTINTQKIDEQTGQLIELNNLAAGKYDVTCELGKSFASRQRETAAAYAEIAAVDPTISELARDVWFKNLDVLGMDVVAERARAMMLQNGTIPPSQWTDEERQQAEQAAAEAAQQPPQEDPNVIFAKAEQGKAEADLMNAENKKQQVQAETQVKIAEIDLRNKQLQLDGQKFVMGQQDKNNVDQAKILQGQEALEIKSRQLRLDEQGQAIEQALAVQKQQQQEINDAINNLKVLREAMGVDAIVGPNNQKAYIDQAQIVDDIQES